MPLDAEEERFSHLKEKLASYEMKSIPNLKTDAELEMRRGDRKQGILNCRKPSNNAT